MQDNSKSEIVIRKMEDSDVSQIVVFSEQEEGLYSKKYFDRLNGQSENKNIALVAEYENSIAGYVYIYPYSKNGLFKNEDFTEIVDLVVFKKYKGLGVEDKLMNAAEKIALDYSNIVYTSVAAQDWESLDFFIKRCFIPHKSGIWNKAGVWHNDESCYSCLDDKNEDKLVFWLYKVNRFNIFRFTIINTFERPYLRWLQEGLKTAIITVNTEDRQRIKIGHEIIVADRQNFSYVKGVVNFRREYGTIRDLLKSEGVKNICPFFNDDDLEKCVQMYQNFPEFHYEKKYGCVALGIRVIETKLCQ